MTKVRREFFDETGVAEYSMSLLGPGLASFTFCRDALEELGVSRPRLQEKVGSAVALFVFRRSSGAPPQEPPPKPVFAQAFGLPFLWVEGRPHSTRLPKGMGAFAEGICRQTGHRGWGLHLDTPLDAVDLSQVTFELESAWAPLAAALELASLGGVSRAAVFSTGRWEEGLGVAGVTGIREKVEAVSRLTGLDEDSRQPEAPGLADPDLPLFYVPASIFQQAREAARGRIEVVSYPPSEPRWKRALTQHLVSLDVPPTQGAHPLEARLDYVNRPHILTDVQLRRDYFMSHVLEDLVAARSSKQPSRQGEEMVGRKVERLVLALSFSYDLTAYVLQSLKPRQALLLVTRETEALVEKVTMGLGDTALKIETLLVEPGSEREVSTRSGEWLMGEPNPKLRAVDITAGTKLVTVALVYAAREANARCFYVTHTYHKGRPLYGQEALETFPWVTKGPPQEASDG